MLNNFLYIYIPVYTILTAVGLTASFYGGYYNSFYRFKITQCTIIALFMNTVSISCSFCFPYFLSPSIFLSIKVLSSGSVQYIWALT